MGQEQSQIDPNTPPHTLKTRSLEGIAEYIQNGPPKRIVVMTGAGISTSAGIPDFRSPDTGLYANLARLDLPHAEAVFDISYFKQNPNPFYVLAKELYPGKFYPTIAHSFVALLAKKELLMMLFTQNIDTLESRAGVPRENIIEAHGSFATQRCIECQTEFPDDLMKKAVESGDVPHCIVPQCNGLVKPDIVFFGESLPQSFHMNTHMPSIADIVIVMGTSLTVHPFAALPRAAREDAPRLLINKEIVGDFGTRLDDVMLLEDCDAGVRKLADALGWKDELEQMWYEVSGKYKEKEEAKLAEEQRGMTNDEKLEAEIEKLTAEVDTSLKISKEHTERVNRQLGTPPNSEDGSVTKPKNTFEEKAADVALLNPSGALTKIKGSLEEPSSTPAPKETTPLTKERLVKESPTQAPITNTDAILDTTLPHNMPDTGTSTLNDGDGKSSSHI